MSSITPFTISRLPRIRFGAGSRSAIVGELLAFGKCVLIVAGARSLRASPHWERLVRDMDDAGLRWDVIAVEGEPSPDFVDQAVAAFKGKVVDVVLGIGGGSALDAAKAIAGLLGPGNTVMDHLEGVGRDIAYRGPAVPLVAVPTTAGTGSEATRNAVLTRQGADGFKKSFRDERLVAQVAIVDPDFLIGCPRELLAANGMDAFTQLLEAFVSVNSNPMTDALALSGIEAFRDGFFAAWENADEARAAIGRSKLAYASLMSGIVLAQAGLGSVHGLASPLGAFFPIPHGVVCGTLVAEATRINIEALALRDPDNRAVAKYVQIGTILMGKRIAGSREAIPRLISTLQEWTERLNLPGLGRYGMVQADIPRVVANCRGGSMKTNPIVLEDRELAELLKRRM